jgi:hypothetical protein
MHAAENAAISASILISTLPLLGDVYAAAGTSQFFVGSSDSYQIDVRDGAGGCPDHPRAVPVTPVTELYATSSSLA